MLKLSDTLEELVAGNPLLQFGLQHRLLNLSQTARYIEPLVEARLKKGVSIESITMALSRYSKKSKKQALQREQYRIERLAMHTGLLVLTYTKTPEAHKGVHKLGTAVQKKSGYITIAQSAGQITVILDAEHAGLTKACVHERPVSTHQHIAAVGVTFSKKYLEIPGFIYIVLQQMMLLNINIIEISSTYTELVLYIKEEDLTIAFEALEVMFVRRQ